MFAAGMMMGGRPVYNINLSSSGSQWRKSVNAAFVPSGIPVVLNITVTAGVEIQSNTTSIAALELDALAAGSQVNLTNLGYLIGKGGAGGAGSSGNGSYADGVDGSAGGHAIRANFTGELDITNASGHLWGGGGGGGGGATDINISGSPNFFATNNYGGGGGGGAGGGAAGAGGTGTVPTFNVSGSNGAAGTSNSPGSHGSGGAGGGGTGGAGGNGGDYGAAGAAGGATSFGSPGAAGSAGNAVKHNAGTSVNFVSGSGNPNIKGAVGT